MAFEIEHKYLVKDESYKDMAYTKVEIRQGYLNRLPQRTVRVRTKGDKGYLTVKGINEGDKRLEFEYEVPFKDALEMLEICEPGIIHKTRWLVDYEGNIWEVDEYHGSHEGMTVAEIEIPDSSYKYTIPPFIGENVTGNPAYYNSNL